MLAKTGGARTVQIMLMLIVVTIIGRHIYEGTRSHYTESEQACMTAWSSRHEELSPWIDEMERALSGTSPEMAKAVFAKRPLGYDCESLVTQNAPALGSRYDRASCFGSLVAARAFEDTVEIKNAAAAGDLSKASLYLEPLQHRFGNCRLKSHELPPLIRTLEDAINDSSHVTSEKRDAVASQLTDATQTACAAYNSISRAYAAMTQALDRGDSVVVGTSRSVMDTAKETFTESTQRYMRLSGESQFDPLAHCR